MKAMDETGQTRMILKGDGEPSLAQAQEAVKATRGQETLLQNPPAYDPQANGSAERAVQEVKAQLRTSLAWKQELAEKYTRRWQSWIG